MEHQLTFFPVGNGDTSLLKLDNNKWFLFDFFHQKIGEDSSNPVIDLKKALNDELRKSNRNFFDVVVFTHSDRDHIQGSGEFFEFDYAKEYQGDDRIKINELWVPAAIILEKDQKDDHWALRQEARYRLKKGKKIKVFSKPDELKKFLEDNDLSVDERRDCIVDAGETVQNITLQNDGVEFFCHSPFISQIDEEEEYRNNSSLILHATFNFGDVDSKIFFIGDTDYECLERIFRKTKDVGRFERLYWDLYYIPHHCSYKALSEDKGVDITIPTKDINDFLKYGRKECYMIASCNPIDNNKEAYDQKMPPHIQAKKCYEKILNEINGRKLIVTMENNNKINPRKAEFKINSAGISLSVLHIPTRTSSASQSSRAGKI